MKWTALVLLFLMGCTVGAIFDNPDGVDPLGASAGVILDDGTPF